MSGLFSTFFWLINRPNTFITNEQKAIPQTQSERMAYILKKLVQTKQPIYVYDLSESLFISESTLRLDLKY